jgi:hypothetical protein
MDCWNFLSCFADFLFCLFHNLNFLIGYVLGKMR